jgi:hypothetical protein
MYKHIAFVPNKDSCAYQLVVATVCSVADSRWRKHDAIRFTVKFGSNAASMFARTNDIYLHVPRQYQRYISTLGLYQNNTFDKLQVPVPGDLYFSIFPLTSVGTHPIRSGTGILYYSL